MFFIKIQYGEGRGQKGAAVFDTTFGGVSLPATQNTMKYLGLGKNAIKLRAPPRNVAVAKWRLLRPAEARQPKETAWGKGAFIPFLCGKGAG